VKNTPPEQCRHEKSREEMEKEKSCCARKKGESSQTGNSKEKGRLDSEEWDQAKIALEKEKCFIKGTRGGGVGEENELRGKETSLC